LIVTAVYIITGVVEKDYFAASSTQVLTINVSTLIETSAFPACRQTGIPASCESGNGRTVGKEKKFLFGLLPCILFPGVVDKSYFDS